MADLPTTTLSRRWLWTLVIGLTLIAALPRLGGLDRLGFYGDEETTALPARALVETGEPKMPSGMPYMRALPLTWLNALSARSFGVERELSYRLPSAIFGTLTIPLLFLLARPLFGTGIAATAALLLALSEWHIVTSREARMYAPFLFFYLAAALMTLRWIGNGGWRPLAIAAALYLAAASLHVAAAMMALFPLLGLAWAGWSRIGPWPLLAFGTFSAVTAWYYDKLVVATAFTSLRAGLPMTQPDVLVDEPTAAGANLPPEIMVTAIGGALLGAWILRGLRAPDRTSGHLLRGCGLFGAAMLAGALTASGHLYGAAIFWLAVLILAPITSVQALQRIAIPAVLLVIIAGAQLVHAVVAAGLSPGIRSLVQFPFPYAWYLLEALGGVFILFLAGTLILAFRPATPGDIPLRASVLAAWLPVFAMGIAEPWGGIRYLIQIYPFLLIVAAYGLLQLLAPVSGRIERFPRQAVAGLLAAVIAASGLLGSHGIPRAVAIAHAGYGETPNPHALGFPVYPDHKGTGEYVRRHRSAGDLVIAEDPLQQYWYSGRVDYWLRDPLSHRRFMFLSEDGRWRDIYVASAALESGMLDLLTGSGDPVWLITSGETRHRRDLYLDEEQRDWLEGIESSHAAAYLGRDGSSAVYCLNCPPQPQD